jgi:hypothetical protein
LSAVANTDYLIAVDGVNGAQGNIYLNWRLGTPPGVGGPAQNLAVTQNASLTLQAGGSTNVTSPRYQWRRNSLDIVGATNATYALTNIQFDRCGSYSVVISNLVGMVTNAIATVSVDSALKLSLDTSSQPANFRLSGSATQAMVLQLSTNLSLWTPLWTNTTPLLPVSFLDTNSVSRNKAYYRLRPWP